VQVSFIGHPVPINIGGINFPVGLPVRSTTMKPWHLMIFAMLGLITKKDREIIDYLLAEIQVLRSLLGKKRLLLTDVERALLARKAKEVGRRTLKTFSTLFTPDRLLRWHRVLCAKNHD
jgi:hypothetical protein